VAEQGQPSGAGTTSTTENVEIEYIFRQKKRSPLSRIGCGVLLVIWFIILFLPLTMFVLAQQGQITISHSGGVPDKHEHPLFRVQLISNVADDGTQQSGLAFTTSSLDRDENTLCIETNVRYLMWAGSGEPARYYDIYERANADADWVYVFPQGEAETRQGSCP
jgi:hypothetical protein